MADAELIAQRLVTAFEHIQRTRMVGVPVLNDRLRVQAIDFQSWQGHWLGVLLTPWFMNLMLLPGEADDWHALIPGSKRTQVFPSGRYEFIAGEEDGVGPYQACSLFSPVFEFDDQAVAVATAEAALEALMDQDNRDRVSTRSAEIERQWNGGEPSVPEADGEDDPAAQSPTLSERLNQPMSRRDLLRGPFVQSDE